ncbi:MAG: nitroreductase family protein [bacterium]|nr:nitroreductase family protein [bacterium]
MTAAFDLSITDRLLSTTRAVRRRLDLKRPVERAVLLDCIRLSQQAPTASNTQRWHWVVVDDPEKRQVLATLYRELSAGLPSARAEFAKDLQTNRVYDSAEWLGENLHRVPVQVIPCIDEQPWGIDTRATAATVYGSILPAVWSFQLALRSRGLGSAFTTLHLYREEEAAKLLGIPDGFLQVALLPVAYTVGVDFKPAQRPPPETVTSWNAWQD